MTYQTSKNLPYSKDLLYEIVADVKNYPEFLPWLKEAVVFDKSTEYFEADLTIKFGPFEQTYRSEVYLSDGSIKTQAKPDGMFARLNSIWVFEAIGADETFVKFSIDFALHSTILQLTVGKFLAEAAEATIKSFEQRAATKQAMNF